MNDSNPLRLISDAELNPVPVFNCIVILGKPDSTGRQSGRVANLSGISASGFGEREILTAIVRKFKDAVQGFAAEDKDIPWIDPPESAGQGESQRYIPVHL